MNNTVRFALISLNLLPYSHISIRKHGERGVEYLGGGSFSSVLERFGNEIIEDSVIIDNILVIHVR